jgi:hypothetical protein
MQTQERAGILKELETGSDALLDAVRGLPEDLAAIWPAPGRWSVVECIEHLAISEDFLLTRIGSSISLTEHSEAAVVSHKREAAILARGADRTNPVISPDVGRPTGRFATLAEAVESFLTTRERTVRLVETCNEDLRSKPMTHPLLGTINCYEALLLIAVHPRRHASQILEIRATLGHRAAPGVT